MDETGTYGQFGRAVYNRDEKEWQFQRRTSPSIYLQPLGDAETLVAGYSEVDAPSFGEDGKEGPSRRRDNQVKALLKLQPELQPAGDLLPDLARISEAIELSSARHDPVKGNLLAFGKIQDESRKRSAEVLAFPAGPTGSDLRVVQIRKQQRGWGNVRGTFLQVPTINGEEATWMGPGVPIQSITFANPIEGGETYLAVRIITQVLIFHPAIRKRPLPGGSRLDLNLLFTIEMERTGGQPFADVAFNPLYSRQFATLDQRGHCTVFQREIGKVDAVKKLASFEQTGETLSRNKTSLQDSWGRITWVSGPSMLAICTRQSCKILEFTEAGLEVLHELDVGLGGVGWILDMVALRNQANFLAILTSHHVVVSQAGKLIATKAAEVLHYRSADDISLRMSSSSEGDDVLLLIHSSFNATVMMFRLHSTDENEVSVADPAEVVGLVKNDGKSTAVSALHLVQVDMNGDIGVVLQDAGLRTDSQDIRFAQLTTLGKDLSLQKNLYVASNHAKLASKLGPPTWSIRLKRAFHQEPNEDFVVDDDDAEEAISRHIQSEPISNFTRRTKHPLVSDRRDWTVNYELSVRRLNDVDVMDVTGMDEAIEMIGAILQGRSGAKAVPFRTLKDLVDDEVTAEDLDSACTMLRQTISQHAPRQYHGVEVEDPEAEQHAEESLIIRPIPALPFLKSPDIDSTDRLRAVCATLTHFGISWDAQDVSELVCHSKEQTALRVAAAVALSSVVIRPREAMTKGVPEAEREPEAKTDVWELPVRPGAPLSVRSQTPSVYLDSQSQIDSPRSPRLPTPSDTGSSASASQANSALARMVYYTAITPTAKPPPLSRRLNRVLSHWNVGEDPADYDWTTTSSHLTRREEEKTQEEGLTEKERLRQQRRTERFVRRQQREAEESARMQLLNSQAPVVLTSTQPVLGGSQQVGAGDDSQSQSQSQGRMAASQVLPGRHGGRPPVKKKKRKKGF